MQKCKPLPDIWYLRECFSVDSSGNLIWNDRSLKHSLSSRSNATFKKMAGRAAGRVDAHGYKTVAINGSHFKQHRIIYKMFFGEIPVGMEVDHINGVKHDNRPCNLRLANSSQNCFNRKRHSTKNGYEKGVYLTNKKYSYWSAQVSHSGEVFRRTFKSREDAIQWVSHKREELHGSFVNHGIHKGVTK